jgi:uncharacterized protein involved in oxidation of intracellular sulfur
MRNRKDDRHGENAVHSERPPYGTERSYHALRLAGSLSNREGEELKLFLIGDAASCAKKDQKVPQGYYIAAKGQVLLCGTCMMPAT